jgi:hypothetical protein
MQTEIQEEFRNEIFVSHERPLFIPKIEHPCLSCSNVSRNDLICQVCNAKFAYADQTEGIENSLYTWETGPDILEKGEIKIATNGKPKRRANGKTIIKKMGYKSEKDMIEDLYFEQGMDLAQVAQHIRNITQGPCTKSYVVCAMQRCGKQARRTHDYRDINGRFSK